MFLLGLLESFPIGLLVPLCILSASCPKDQPCELTQTGVISKLELPRGHAPLCDGSVIMNEHDIRWIPQTARGNRLKQL